MYGAELPAMGQNLIEKIVQAFAVDLEESSQVHAGDYVTVRPQHVMTHDNTAAVMQKFAAIGAPKVAYPQQPVYALDHNVQDTSDKNLEKYANIAKFAEKHGVDFYPAGRGIGHQVMAEEGYAWPGTLVVASDSHSNLYGGLGALGTPVVRTDAAALWATGTTWFQIPPVAKVVFKNRLLPGVSGKDVIISLCGFFNNDEVLNHAVEFTGEGVADLPIDQRLTIANMTTEWGALAGVFPIDGILIDWLKQRAQQKGHGHPRLHQERIRNLEESGLASDADAYYAKTISLDLSSVRPHVSGPNSVKDMVPVAAMETRKVAVHKAYLLSCVNGRVDDLAEAAEVLKDKKISSKVQMYIAAASSEVEAESRARGDWDQLLNAGAIALPPGCGPCIGLGKGLLEDGEVGISATNRNFRGRMGSREAEAYLASPRVVAASALSGYICCPDDLPDSPLLGKVAQTDPSQRPSDPTRILPGFPESLEGELLFCDADNMNTDGIYPGAYTYREDLTREQMAEVVMENYDPKFQEVVQQGDLLVGGYNFGTGSSREQAATALLYRGLRLVIAGSFSATYKRNALNNGYLLVDCPGLVEFLRSAGEPAAPSVRTGWKAKVDFAQSEVRLSPLREDALAYTKEAAVFGFAPLGPSAQQLVIEGGLENLVSRQLK